MIRTPSLDRFLLPFSVLILSTSWLLLSFLPLTGGFLIGTPSPAVVRHPDGPSRSQAFLKTHTVLAARNRRIPVATTTTTQQLFSVTDENKWFPRTNAPKIVYDDDIYGALDDDKEAEDDDDIEVRAVKIMARILHQRLEDIQNGTTTSNNHSDDNINANDNNKNAQYAKGRFIDLTCTAEGEQILENLFRTKIAAAERDPKVIQAAVMALQSILILGTQVGVKGSPVQLQRMVAHLDSRGNQQKFLLRDLETWDTDSVRRLKHQVKRGSGLQVLAEMKWKRTTQGAFELLVAIGAWGKHEDLALLRSGFSLRFNDQELQAAENAASNQRDLDEELGLRQDLRHLKVFTIDSAETSEIDDGLSLEKYTDKDGSEQQRIWIHIADAERWVEQGSELYDIARRRVTSLYLPQFSIPMLPPKANDDLMSLTTKKDAYALSLAVELNDDGSIDESTLMVTPSLIRVSYRLTYEEVDEMLEEGIGYSEEWELGGLLDKATTRRNYRIRRGSSEGLVQRPIPQKTISISPDESAPDGIDIKVSVQATHNSGANQTFGAEAGESSSSQQSLSTIVEPLSSAHTLVTECMILAGEAIGTWKLRNEKSWPDVDEETGEGFRNELRLPFRGQRKPDYASRARERQVMMQLMEYNTGDGYCHAWYCRRFLSPVKVTEHCAPHAGLGLSSYVQWTSPIRRKQDLMVHCAVKRWLRRQRIQELILEGKSLEHLNLSKRDIGWTPPRLLDAESNEYEWDTRQQDDDIDYREGGGLMGAARLVQRTSEQYWLFEYIRRIIDKDPDYIWDALILGYIGTGEKSKKQYAIYVYELGFEYKFSSPINLNPGERLKLRVSLMNPRAGQLAFVRTNC
ncbi:Ribonuclease II, chloroplastic/mitochondrial [Seminavis robusta]|uniref:Ribonuclease II, chloroplastic/mitochondrial n=1 Tax=Seminavis robusta TaxID=568900 RepID=A0A9N8DH36_9STRA|nr:Ribonuclease II, chloroplastic/mitochondrial [Seminavis robusta]|eukprot:Sro142_g066190.1 Ribonuclease II, chloroplastic/mitochondrial (857) ;mRNA; r:38391-41349